jgi:hypothetical protein
MLHATSQPSFLKQIPIVSQKLARAVLYFISLLFYYFIVFVFIYFCLFICLFLLACLKPPSTCGTGQRLLTSQTGAMISFQAYDLLRSVSGERQQSDAGLEWVARILLRRVHVARMRSGLALYTLWLLTFKNQCRGSKMCFVSFWRLSVKHLRRRTGSDLYTNFSDLDTNFSDLSNVHRNQAYVILLGGALACVHLRTMDARVSSRPCLTFLAHVMRTLARVVALMLVAVAVAVAVVAVVIVVVSLSAVAAAVAAAVVVVTLGDTVRSRQKNSVQMMFRCSDGKWLIASPVRDKQYAALTERVVMRSVESPIYCQIVDTARSSQRQIRLLNPTISPFSTTVLGRKGKVNLA